MKERKEDVMEMLPDLLKAIREAVGATQVELAATLGISRTLVTMWESGKVTPDKDRLKQWLTWATCKIELLRSYDSTLRQFRDLVVKDIKRSSASEFREFHIWKYQAIKDNARKSSKKMNPEDWEV